MNPANSTSDPSSPGLGLRGGAFEHSYGYDPNFTRRVVSSAATERGGRQARSRQRKDGTSTVRAKSAAAQSRSRSGGLPWIPPGGEYEAAANDPLHERRASRLGIRDSLLRPASRHRSPPAEGRGGEGDEGDEGDEEWGERRWLGQLPFGETFLPGMRSLSLPFSVPFRLPWQRQRQRGLEELLSGVWRPTRTRFEIEWPRVELESSWYEMVYTHLYVRAGEFADEYFMYGDIPAGSAAEPGGEGSVWMQAAFSSQFRWYVAKIAKQDIHAGGWDALLAKGLHRKYLVTGIIGKLLETCVFDELLFGADAEQRRMLEAQDRCTLDMEGYQRTELRSRTVHAIMANDILTPDFWPCVDRLALQLTTLLLSLIHLLDKHFPASRETSLRSIHQDLHALVSQAAYMSIGIRRSRDIFRFSSPFPGEVWDLDQEHVDDTIYKQSKALTDEADKAAERRHRARRRGSRQRAESPRPLTIGERGRALVTSLLNVITPPRSPAWGDVDEQDADDLNTPNSFRHPSRLAKVQIVVWPMLQRFASGVTVDPVSGTAEGQHITTLFKAQAVYYCGRIDQPGEQYEERPTLEEWVREKTRDDSWRLPRELPWVAYFIACWLLISVLLGTGSMAYGLLNILPAEGLVGFVRHILLRMLINSLKIYIVASQILLFIVYATKNTAVGLFGLALRKGPFPSSWVRGIGLHGMVTDGDLFAYPNFKWESIKGAANAVVGHIVWEK